MRFYDIARVFVVFLMVSRMIALGPAWNSHSCGLSHFSITDCRSTFVFPFLDKHTWCSWNAPPNRVKDLWRGGAAIDHNRRRKRNEGKEKKQRGREKARLGGEHSNPVVLEQFSEPLYRTKSWETLWRGTPRKICICESFERRVTSHVSRARG